VLVTLGVRAIGERVVLDLRLVGEESAASWTEVVASLAARHLARPVLAVIDGNPGLTNALRSHWPGMAIQDVRRITPTSGLCRPLPSAPVRRRRASA
jgi:transposase-like protein